MLSDVIVAAVTLKLVEEPEGTFTVTGTVRAELSLVTATSMPPAGTVFESVMAQELLALDPRVDGVQTKDWIVTVATRATVVLADDPL
jgi:hypothetical protein